MNQALVDSNQPRFKNNKTNKKSPRQHLELISFYIVDKSVQFTFLRPSKSNDLDCGYQLDLLGTGWSSRQSEKMSRGVHSIFSPPLWFLPPLRENKVHKLSQSLIPFKNIIFLNRTFPPFVVIKPDWNIWLQSNCPFSKGGWGWGGSRCRNRQLPQLNSQGTRTCAGKLSESLLKTHPFL